MKKALCGLCLLLTAALLWASAAGEITYPAGPGQMGYDAVVISKNVSVRPSQNANAKAVTRLNYGQRFAAMPLGNGWCEVYLSETEGMAGYALEDYLLVNPAFITLEESTPVYAWQARNAKRVGLLATGETYPIIRTEGSWMLISLRGAAGWIVRPNGDPTGTAGMRTNDVLKRAEQYLLSTNPWVEDERLTSEKLKDYYSFAEFDAANGEWKVTFDSRRGTAIVLFVNDATGEVRDDEPVNG